MNKRSGIVKFAGHPVTLVGNEVKTGTPAPSFIALNTDLTPFTLESTAGHIRIISVVPSIDTSVCDMQTRWFNEEATKLPNVKIISISVDLPFALKKYCATQGIENVHTVSDHKDLNFGLNYGFVIEEFRLLTRGIVVIDAAGIVRHVEYVPNVGDQPNYESALQTVKAALK